MSTLIADSANNLPLLGQRSQHRSSQESIQSVFDHGIAYLSGYPKSIAVAFQSPSHKAYLVIAILSGIVCGFVAFIYSTVFQGVLNLVWKWAPRQLVLPFLLELQKRWPSFEPGRIAWMYTVGASTAMGTAAGVVQSLMGSPGDLPETVESIHVKVRPEICFLMLVYLPTLFSACQSQ